MIPVRLIVESRFLRSSVAAFAQMFTLGTVLVAVLEDGSARPMAWGVVVASLLTITVPALMRRKVRP